MVFANDFADMMNDTLRWQQLASRDDYGKPIYQNLKTFNCRRYKKQRLVTDPHGKQVVSTQQAWILGNPPISPEDQIILSDNSTPVIAAVDRPEDESGQDAFTKVYFL